MIFRKKILFKNFDKEMITVQPLIFNGFDKIGLLMILIKNRQDSAEEKRSAALATAGALRSDNRKKNMFQVFSPKHVFDFHCLVDPPEKSDPYTPAKEQMIDDKKIMKPVLLQRLRRPLRVCSLRHLPLLYRQRKELSRRRFQPFVSLRLSRDL